MAKPRIKTLEKLVDEYRALCAAQNEEIKQKRERIAELGLTINRQQFVIMETRKAAGLEFEDGVSLPKHVKYMRDLCKWRTDGRLS
jgi:hypothetical protein